MKSTTVGDYLFFISTENSLFYAKEFPVGAEQGIVRSALELRRKWTP
jgi:hypothetical protein